MHHATALPAPADRVLDAPPRLLADAIRMLAVDAVQEAGSGHPGMPMGMADAAEVLWREFLHHDPADPRWPDRDRVVVSNGHGSMLLYALLHLTGYELSIADLRRFRRFGSRTPGHPEHGVTPGVETTTGPLGQGLANAVGMALAERLLAAEFNRTGFDVIDHRTYVLLGDGCLMEGISHEAASLAGALGLGKLVCLYDDNGISIDGKVEGWFRDDTARRFAAYGWHVVPEVDGHDRAAIMEAIALARTVDDRPSLVCLKTVIGKGSPSKAGTAGVHGTPLGAAEVAATRASLGWQHPPFEIPADVYAAFDARPRGAARHRAWKERLAAYEQVHPGLAAELRRRLSGALPADLDGRMARLLDEVAARREPTATRKASQEAIAALAEVMPELLGGSADLSHSNLTWWKGARPVAGGEGGGNYLHYGVRELGMAALMNGLALHGGFVPYGGTFLVFSDYARSALRMAALMRVRSIFVLTHDSIGVGEDGPTHQPVEHAASLRLLPHLDVWRPCDAVETATAWRAAVERRGGPTALLLSRQELPPQRRDSAQIAAVSRGGYVLADAAGSPEAVIIATGSEVQLAMAAREQLAAKGIAARVVSMPCTSVFDRQAVAFRDAVLPRGIPRVAVEAGVSDGWRKYVGLEGAVVGLDSFGECGPAHELFRHFGLTPDRVADEVLSVVRRAKGAGTWR